MPRKYKTASSPFAKVCAIALSLALVVTMCPIVGFAEDSGQTNAAAVGDAQVGQPSAIDSQVDAPDDAVSIPSNISLGGEPTDAANAVVADEPSPDNGEDADANMAATPDADNADAEQIDGIEDAQSGEAQSVEPGPNPFKSGVSAQNLATLDNCECDNYPELDKSLLWKTSASCSGKKMWRGTLVQDNGYWNEPGWTFECGWEAPNPLHDAEMYAYLDKGFTNTVDGQARDVVKLYGDGGLTSVDIAAVLDGSYDVYIPVGAFNYQHLQSITFPSFVKEIETYAFSEDYLNDYLTSITFETDAKGDGIQRICDGAFSNCEGLASQDLIVLPASLQYLGDAFDSCGAVTLRIDNPDVRLAHDDDYEGNVYAPCDAGSTVYAYKKRTDGMESDPWKLSQDEGNGINWVWLDDNANAVNVAGTIELPEDVSAADVKVSVQQGAFVHNANVENDGSFTVQGVMSATETLVTIEIPGYCTIRE